MLRWLVLAGLVACRIGDVDLTGKQCPCPDGYTCDVATNTCARSLMPADAKKIDGAAPDGQDDGSAAYTCPTGVDICDTFEGSMLPAWVKNNAATLDATVAHRGTGSLHVHLDALPKNVGGRATITEVQTFAMSTPFWVRIWVNITSLPEATNHLEILAVEQNSSPQSGDYVFLESDKVEIYSDFSHQIRGTTSPAATGTWLCLLWQVVPSGTTGQLELSGDIQVPLSYSGQTDSDPHIGNLAIGLQFASSNVAVAQPALDAWIDDVIVDHAAVTCTD